MQQPVYFLRLDLENVRCFGEKASLDLSDGNDNWRKWTVILGDNGTGKTTLLQLISGLEQVKLNLYEKGIRTEKLALGCKLYEKAFYNIKYLNKNNQKAVIKAKSTFDEFFVGWDYSLFMDQSINTSSSSMFQLNTIDELICFGYGATRVMSSGSLVVSQTENSETLFNDESQLVNAEEWLLNMDYAASRESDLKDFAIKRKALIIEVLKSILPDIQDIQFTTPTKEKLTPSVEFQTEYGYWVSIHQLSLGYKTMVAWMVDLAARMFERYPESDNPLAEPAIVLVDEIDLHLHPKWQRKIFDYLSDKFPQTQFVVTAHSPLVVQSAPKDANIVVLRKEGDHVVIDNDVKSVQNWRLDQILSSDLFGGIPVRNDNIESILKRRNELMGHASLSQAEQNELDALNDEVGKLPYAESEVDIEAKEIIRKAAEYFKHQGVH